MGYTIAQASKKCGLSRDTLRYYDKEGLLPFVGRNGNGYREFSDQDLEWLGLICCLKNTGMPLREIREVIALTARGDGTLRQRRQILIRHRAEVLAQIGALKKNLEKIDRKIACYEREEKTPRAEA